MANLNSPLRLVGLLWIVLPLISCGSNREAIRAEARLDPDMVSFKSTDEGVFSSPVTLTASLKKPAGAGPFPAVVLLHGCAGKQPARDDLWARRLVEWGYVALQLDSFGPRGLLQVCTDGFDLSFLDDRAGDAYDARDYLATLSFIDRDRIAVLGWSHGGMTVLRAVRERDRPPFRAAVAFYPYCHSGALSRRNAPVLILIGDADDWTPARLCVSEMPSGTTSPEIALKVYHGAYYAFDRPGPDVYINGFRGSYLTRYDRDADTEAVAQVRHFLEQYLR